MIYEEYKRNGGVTLGGYLVVINSILFHFQ